MKDWNENYLSRDDMAETLHLCISTLQCDSETEFLNLLVALKQLTPFISYFCPQEYVFAGEMQDELILDAGASLYFSYYFDVDQHFSKNKKLSGMKKSRGRGHGNGKEKLPESLVHALCLNLVDGWLCKDNERINFSRALLLIDFTDNFSKGRTRQIVNYVLPILRATYRRISSKQMSSCVKLTNRETEILSWIREGKSSWEISTILNCSKRTVEFHVNNLKKKLNAENRTQALVKALQMKLINF